MIRIKYGNRVVRQLGQRVRVPLEIHNRREAGVTVVISDNEESRVRQMLAELQRPEDSLVHRAHDEQQGRAGPSSKRLGPEGHLTGRDRQSICRYPIPVWNLLFPCLLHRRVCHGYGSLLPFHEVGLAVVVGGLLEAHHELHEVVCGHVLANALNVCSYVVFRRGGA